MENKEFVVRLGILISEINFGLGDLAVALEQYSTLCTYLGLPTPDLRPFIGNLPYELRGEKSKVHQLLMSSLGT